MSRGSTWAILNFKFSNFQIFSNFQFFSNFQIFSGSQLLSDFQTFFNISKHTFATKFYAFVLIIILSTWEGAEGDKNPQISVNIVYEWPLFPQLDVAWMALNRGYFYQNIPFGELSRSPTHRVVRPQPMNMELINDVWSLGGQHPVNR